jgi:SAM-dependent methyltransferase
LAEWLHELNFKTGVEVGVAAGEYSEILCEANPKMKLYGVDPWLPYAGYRDYTRTSTFATLYADAKRRLEGRPNYEFIKEFSMDALRRFDDNTLDFVYIDANHQDPYVGQDIAAWHKKVRPGGILAGHDYARPKGKDGSLIHNVKGAVQSYAADNNIKPWFVLGSFKAQKGEIRDSVRTWMWVKM